MVIFSREIFLCPPNQLMSLRTVTYCFAVKLQNYSPEYELMWDLVLQNIFPIQIIKNVFVCCVSA